MSHIPNAWDDEPDSLSSVPRNPPPAPKPSHASPPRISRAERTAQHEAANRALWNSAENPDRFHFLEVNNDVPLSSQPRPKLKVLSRKPKKPDAPAGLEAGMQGLSFKQRDEEDSEEEERRQEAAKLRDRQEAAQREREEKQRRYNERRQELFGTSNDQMQSGSGASSKPSASSRGRGGRRARGGAGGGGGGGRGSHTPSSVEHSPARQSIPGPRQLYDPGSSSRPEGVSVVRRSEVEGVQPLRQPRGAGTGAGFGRREGGPVDIR